MYSHCDRFRVRELAQSMRLCFRRAGPFLGTLPGLESCPPATVCYTTHIGPTLLLQVGRGLIDDDTMTQRENVACIATC